MYYVCVDNSFVASDGGTKKSIADDGDDAAGCGGWWWWDAGDVDMTSVTPFWNELSSWLTASLHDVRDVDGSPPKPQNNDGGAAAGRVASPLAVRQSVSQSIKTLIQVDKPQRAGPYLRGAQEAAPSCDIFNLGFVIYFNVHSLPCIICIGLLSCYVM